MKVRLQYIRGSSAKYYEVAASGNDVTIRFGRIGTAGQSQVKTLPDAAAAVKHAERLVRSKLAKGYQQTSAC
jgi:predicted DNA-binding WGR domain protein